jgi:hypothetical protein
MIIEIVCSLLLFIFAPLLIYYTGAQPIQANDDESKAQNSLARCGRVAGI